MARIGIVTPLRDGMNLVAKEFVAAQDAADPGVLVLSRFAGAAQELDGCLTVNPLDPDDIAEALDVAMDMPADERLDRWTRMAATVRANTASVWCARFLTALEGSEAVAEAGKAGGSRRANTDPPASERPHQKTKRVPSRKLRP